MRSELEAALTRHRLVEDDAVRIADRHEHRLHAPCGSVEVDVLRFTGKIGRQVRGAKRGPADVQLGHDLGAVSLQHADRVGSVGRGQLESVARAMVQDRMGGDDPEPIAALLGLRAVRVEDAHAHRVRVEREQAVRAEAPVPVA